MFFVFLVANLFNVFGFNIHMKGLQSDLEKGGGVATFLLFCGYSMK